MSDSTLRLMKFYWDCGRMGTLHGMFLVDQGEYDQLMALVGKRIDFGECLGKHSEIQGVLESEDLKVICEDQAFLSKAVGLGVDLDSGFNPLDYADDEVFEDEDEEPEE